MSTQALPFFQDKICTIQFKDDSYYKWFLYISIVRVMSSFSGLVRFKSKRLFINPNSVSRHLYCSICQDVFEDPVRTICGHTFCYVCIQQWALVKNACPLCKHALGGRKLERDLIAACIIGDLEVRCFHEGCQWTGIESIRKKHQRCCLYKPKNYISNSHSLPVVEVSDLDQIQDVDALQILSKPDQS